MQKWLVGGLVVVAIVVAIIAGVTVTQRGAREVAVVEAAPTIEATPSPTPQNTGEAERLAAQQAEIERLRRERDSAMTASQLRQQEVERLRQAEALARAERDRATQQARAIQSTPVGRWRITAQWNQGSAPADFDIEFLANNRFEVSDAAGGRGEGSWSMNGSQLTWRYSGSENMNTVYTGRLTPGQMSGTMTADDNWRGTFVMTR